MAKTIKITIEEEKPKKTPAKKKKPTGRPLKCAYCNGTGKDPVIFGMCRVCDGTGRVRPDIGKKKCVYCNNTGIDPILSGVPCTKCHGWGYIKK
ncbi:MAG TPA: hypothetical protein VMW67_04445 [Desulfobacteria bacterium]|nr:hypothetical protein [Desulfobacteria bacterium]